VAGRCQQTSQRPKYYHESIFDNYRKHNFDKLLRANVTMLPRNRAADQAKTPTMQVGDFVAAVRPAYSLPTPAAAGTVVARLLVASTE
jgi:hypothetical protein